MQNFKQFLLKEENHNPQGYDLSLCLNFETGIHIPEIVEDYTNPDDVDITEQSIQGEMRQLLHYQFEAYFDSSAEFIISIDIPSSDKNINHSYISGKQSEIWNAMTEIFNGEVVNNHSIPIPIVNVRQQLSPDIKIENAGVQFYLPWAKPFTLSGIDKQLDCEYIRLSHPEKIVGNVLSLLKIKKFRMIYCQDAPKWVKIVNSHLLQKDILECQEELITTGLKQYAKL